MLIRRSTTHVLFIGIGLGMQSTFSGRRGREKVQTC